MKAVPTELADLERVVQELADRVSVLTEAVDALTDEIQWRNSHARDTGERLPPVVITSLPLDPCSADWAVNRVPREQVTAMRDDLPRTTRSGRLFE